MKILITGSKGQLGKGLVDFFKKDISKNIKELIITDIEENSIDNHKICLDITNKEQVNIIINKYKPDIIINCAAMTAVDMCENEQEQAYKINSSAVLNLAKAASSVDAIFFHISTDYVFDGNKNTPYIESDETNPISIYGKSKLEGEKHAINFNKKTYVIRTAWLYGDGKNFVKTMLGLAKKGQDIKVVDDQFGSPTSAKELAKAIAYIIDNNNEKYGVYHITSSGSSSWYEFAREIFNLSKVQANLKAVSSDNYITLAKRPKYSVLSNDKLLNNYKYKMANWKDGLKEYINNLKY